MSIKRLRCEHVAGIFRFRVSSQLQHWNSPSQSYLPRQFVQVRRASSLPVASTSGKEKNGPSRPLATLPLSQVMRSYLIMAISSSPTAVNMCMGVLYRMVQSKNILFNVDRNPFLRWILRQTFYDQFCAGENNAEVRKTVETLHKIGYNGIILEYSLEVLEESTGVEDAALIQRNINTWKDGLIQSMDLISPGDFVGLKSVFMICAFLVLTPIDGPAWVLPRCDAYNIMNRRPGKWQRP